MNNLKNIFRQLKYMLWALNGFIGLRFCSNVPQRAMVLITYYNPTRMKHVNHQLRNIFKCDFVRQVIISNHNPEVDIAALIKVKDERITVVNQSVRKGCGHRWLVAHEYAPEYLIVVDDDILIFPWQLKWLFETLVAEPEIPHGFAGMVRHKNDFLEYRELAEQSLDYICEIYALTGEHLKRFMELRRQVLRDESLTGIVEYVADFMIVSRSGNSNPKIHNAGRLFRCPTYNKKGIAVHQDRDFGKSILKVARRLDNLVLATLPER